VFLLQAIVGKVKKEATDYASLTCPPLPSMAEHQVMPLAVRVPSPASWRERVKSSHPTHPQFRGSTVTPLCLSSAVPSPCVPFPSPYAQTQRHVLLLCPLLHEMPTALGSPSALHPHTLSQIHTYCLGVVKNLETPRGDGAWELSPIPS
jgi:hypothetical protein